MTSQINPNNIDGTYPVAGQPNNTQGMRDNFTNTKTNFQYAADEITELQTKSVLKSALTGSTLDNNMNDNLIYAVKLNDVCYTYLQNTATSGTITLDYSASQYQYVSTTGSVSLAFANWCPTGSAGYLNLTINITNVAHTLTLPASVSVGLYGIQGISPGTPGVTNTITFGATGTYTFRFSSTDGGTTIDIFDFSRAYNQFAGNVYINGTTTSTSPETGALQVVGGTGIQGNLNVGGNILATDGGAVGYNTGAGGTVSQSGNKSGGVTLNKLTGEITMQNTNLAADTTVSFTLTNSTIGARDLLLMNIVGGVATGAAYNLDANCTSGSAVISVRNITGGTLGEAIVLRYAVIRGSIA